MADITELDVIFGEYRDQEAVDQFVRAARSAGLTGTLYIGYPVLSVDDVRIEYDALLISDVNGAIIFDLYGHDGSLKDDVPETLVLRQEQLYAALYNKLNSFKELRQGRKLSIEISTVTIHPISDIVSEDQEVFICSLNRLSEIPRPHELKPIDSTTLQHLNASVQRISNLKPVKKRENVTRPNSKGAAIKQIEAQIANLDLWQKRGSIEYVNGPQRIRGLAGSGKTVVLALKAAYIHVKRPDWRIAVTFNTRSLYQQFEALVTRFVYSQINEEPDWDRIKIMHAWGGSGREGVYSLACKEFGIQFRDFSTAARMFGYSKAFFGACSEALDAIGMVERDIFDMVLVDEAQDLPEHFFRLVYKMTKPPRRIVWAYDDLQNLGDFRMPSESDLFGRDASGEPIVKLRNEQDQPQQDIVLPRCYRNPPWTLVTAHGLGFGLKKTPVVQMFPDPGIWRRLGYEVVEGELGFGKNVAVRRSPKSIPGFFNEILAPEDSLQFMVFDQREKQYEWVAEKIKSLIEDDELEHTDVMVVIPDVLNSKSATGAILGALRKAGLQGHAPGLTSSKDVLFREGYIAVTHIYRAKGNEAPVVFVVDAEFGDNQSEIKKRRNVIFTAITRSRAWTYVCGTGGQMQNIASEMAAIKGDGYILRFQYPAEAEIDRLSVSSDTVLSKRVDGSNDDFEDLRVVLEKYKGKIDEMPSDLRRQFEDFFGAG